MRRTCFAVQLLQPPPLSKGRGLRAGVASYPPMRYSIHRNMHRARRTNVSLERLSSSSFGGWPYRRTVANSFSTSSSTTSPQSAPSHPPSSAPPPTEEAVRKEVNDAFESGGSSRASIVCEDIISRLTLGKGKRQRPDRSLDISMACILEADRLEVKLSDTTWLRFFQSLFAEAGQSSRGGGSEKRNSVSFALNFLLQLTGAHQNRLQRA
eukprot:jgi/Bigna1/81702/fgenesh1_pg.83_\